MTNKFIIPLIVVLSLITIGVVSLTQLNKSSEKVALNTSSATVSSVKPQVVIGSSSIQGISSVAVSSSQKVEESKVESVVTVESKKPVQDNSKCNLPESENLVKTEDGCFIFSSGGRVTGTNSISEGELDSLNIYFKQAAINYYSKVNSKFLSSQHFINANYTKKINDTSFEVYLGMIDAEYYNKKYVNVPGDYSDLNTAKYSISKNLTTAKWSYQFINFETLK